MTQLHALEGQKSKQDKDNDKKFFIDEKKDKQVDKLNQSKIEKLRIELENQEKKLKEALKENTGKINTEEGV